MVVGRLTAPSLFLLVPESELSPSFFSTTENKSFRFQVKGLFMTFRREPQSNGEFWYLYQG